MGSAGKQLDKHAAAVMTSASPWSIEERAGAAPFPSPCPEDVFMGVSCPSASSELPTVGNPEVHLSASDVRLKNFSVLGRAAKCVVMASPKPCDYSSPTENISVHTMEGAIAWDVPAHTALPPSISNHDFTPSRDISVHVTPQSTLSLLPWMCDPEPSKRVFLESYMKNLLPALKRIHSEGSSISLNEKVSAVKLAADMSLAISAGVDNTWSQALIQELASTSTSNILPFSSPSRVKRKKKSSIFRGSFYARGGSSQASALQEEDSHAAYVGGGHNSMSTFKGASVGSFARRCSCASLPRSASSARLPRGGSYASCFKDSHHPRKFNLSSCTGRMSQLRACCLASKKERRRQSGQYSYMKILRNSRSFGGLKASTDALNEAGRASSPSISKVQIESLGGLVPGGRNMDVPLLLQEAADYILSLKMQVEALESLSHLVSL